MEISVITFILLYFALNNYLLFGWKKTFRKQSQLDTTSEISTFVSIICPFRNEIDNLSNFIDSIEKQNFPKDQFELILINDHSEDQSLEHVNSILSKYSSSIKIESLPESETSKKAALILGLKKAKGELIITTDCDTIRGKNWISSILSTLNITQSDMIIGPVRIRSNEQFFSRFQSIEFLSLQIATIGFAGNKNAILCNGSNLAFRKVAFDKVGGYSGQKTASGDDFFLLMKFKKEGMKISFNHFKEGMVEIAPLPSLKSFVNQRLRWAGKTIHAKDLSFYFTGIFNTSFSLFQLVLPIFELMQHSFPKYTLLIYAVKFNGDHYLLKLAAKQYNLTIKFKDLLPSFLFYPFYISYIFMLSLIKKPIWKDRQI